MANSVDLPIDPRGVLILEPVSGDPNGVSMEQLTILSIDDYSKYSQAYRVINDIAVGGVFTYFLVTASDLRAGIAAANQGFLDRRFAPQTRAVAAQQWAGSLRAAVLSLVSALTYHQEQVYQLASELHRGNEQVRAAIKSVFSDLYDANRGYRLLYRLRNLMAHHTMEVVALTARALWVKDHVESRFSLRIDRRVAVQSTKLNTEVRKELEEMLHDPDIIDLLEEVWLPLSGANRQLYGILYPDLRRYCEAVLEFESLFRGRVGTRALVRNWDPDTPGERPSYTAWAPEIFVFAARYLDG